MPPFGVFASEFLILTTAMKQQPWATPILLLALGVAFAAIFGRVQPMVFGETTAQAPAASAGAAAGVRAPGAGADARPVHPAVPGRLVSRGGAPDRGALTCRCDAGWTQARSRCPAAPARAPRGRRRGVAGSLAQRRGRRRRAVAGAVGDASGARGTRGVRAALLADGRVLVARAARCRRAPSAIPGSQDDLPVRRRMQRAVFDLCGVRADDPDQRPWLRHAAWPAECLPLAPSAVPASRRERRSPTTTPSCASRATACMRSGRARCTPASSSPATSASRWSARRCCRLEERLGYVHKGIERRFTGTAAAEGHRLAARVSGDSAVAFSWAYCQALEGARRHARCRRARCGCARCAWSSSASQNHLGDLGALGNDAGFAFGLAQFSRLKEQLLRATEQALGQRYLLDFVVPGGSASTSRRPAAPRWRTACGSIAAEAATLRDIYDEHAGVRDRFVGAGKVAPELAASSGSSGSPAAPAARRSTCASTCPAHPTTSSASAECVRTRRRRGGARRRALRRAARIRAARAADPARDCPAGRVAVAVSTPPARAACGIGLIEGWRGPVLVALEAGAAGRIRRCHPHDPSWQNWPVLEHAIIGNIVPDFPLINKSFNLSYSGHDLYAMLKTLRTIAAIGIVTEPPPAAGRRAARARRAAGQDPRRSSAARCASARSTPAPATAASSRSTRSTTRSTTSRDSASASSPARGTPTCCW